MLAFIISIKSNSGGCVFSGQRVCVCVFEFTRVYKRARPISVFHGSQSPEYLKSTRKSFAGDYVRFVLSRSPRLSLLYFFPVSEGVPSDEIAA